MNFEARRLFLFLQFEIESIQLQVIIPFFAALSHNFPRPILAAFSKVALSLILESDKIVFVFHISGLTHRLQLHLIVIFKLSNGMTR